MIAMLADSRKSRSEGKHSLDYFVVVVVVIVVIVAVIIIIKKLLLRSVS